ncbi:MAG: tRNA pseudouridine(38-40) synthase TruA [Clostridia bacterium]
MRYKITIEYSGKNYGGWQRQKNANSIQEELENALSTLFEQKIVVFGSGRTDAGVHAYGQVAHFDANNVKIPTEKLVYPLNILLPSDIKVKDCSVADDSFHAQFDAKRKTYIYKTYLARISSPIKDGFYAQTIPPINTEKIREAAQLLVGEHNFKSFSASGGTPKKSFTRIIYRIDIKEDGEDIIFEVEGNGFLYNMVRIIVGTLIAVGKDKIPKENILLMLGGAPRKLGGKTYPPDGLYLKEVIY